MEIKLVNNLLSSYLINKNYDKNMYWEVIAFIYAVHFDTSEFQYL